MRQKTKILSSVGIAMAIIFPAVFLASTAEVGAESGVTAIEGVSYTVQASIADNLKVFIGKNVTVTLDSGVSFSGSVKKVGDHLVHLENLEGKDFFDALIRIENISAIEAKFRKYKP